MNIGFRGILHPRRVSSEHGADAVPMLADNEERILSNHQIPADGRVVRHIWSAVSEAQALGGLPPAFREVTESSNRSAVGTKEQVVMRDRSPRLEPSRDGV